MDIPARQQNINFPGYGFFWVANSISATIIGMANRETQSRSQERGIEFQKELHRIRELTEDYKLAEEIAFKRRLMALGRHYAMIQSAEGFEMQKRLTEMKYYIERYWPLDKTLLDVILEDIKNSITSDICDTRLNVILLHAPILPLKKYHGGANDMDDQIYKNIEYSIYHNDIPLLGDIKYYKDSHSEKGILKYDLKGGNTNFMNIHFLMSQLPTLVISPCYSNGKMQFNGAVWEPQAARPLIRNLFTIDHNPEKALSSEDYRHQQINLIHTSIAVITGVVRDSYMMLTAGKTPTLHCMLNDLAHKNMNELVQKNKQLLNFIRSEQDGIIAALDENKLPKLFEAYHPKDIALMKGIVQDSRI